jgi:lantibiotic modifying enzyme
MRPEDDERHVAQIRAAFVAADRAAAPASGPAAPSAIAAASAIADELARAAVATREGGVDWLLPREADGRWQLARVDLGLVHGRAGIGLFFAAAARVTGEPRYRELARLSFRWQAASLPLAEAPLAHGDGSGPGSLVYALTVAGELLEDTALVADAKSWRALLEPSPRAPFDEVALLRALAETTDDHSDALGDGAAGRADAALELAQRSGDAAWAARARAHADALVARSGGYRIPLAPGCQRPGLFDGLAGIGYALLRQVDPSLPCVLFWEAER